MVETDRNYQTNRNRSNDANYDPYQTLEGESLSQNLLRLGRTTFYRLRISVIRLPRPFQQVTVAATTKTLDETIGKGTRTI